MVTLGQKLKSEMFNSFLITYINNTVTLSNVIEITTLLALFDNNLFRLHQQRLQATYQYA